jgi:hypothetical protein
VAPPPSDILPLREWRDRPLGANRPGDAVDIGLVLVIRGDLVRRFPELIVYAVKAKRLASGAIVPALPERLRAEGEADAVEEAVMPVFSTRLPSDMLLVGFPFDAEKARGTSSSDGLFIVFEERIGEPRFGLDGPIDPVTPPASWNDLSWSHFGLAAEDAVGTYLDDPQSTPGPIDGDTGRWLGTTASAASRARITLQRPVRLAIPFSRVLPLGTSG